VALADHVIMVVADPEGPYLDDHESGPRERRHAEAGPGVVCS
jgi:hypothetical protein